MITFKDVSYRYSGSKAETLKNFSLTLNTGSIVGLLGANGAGKSTLLYLACGLLRPNTGEIRIGGYIPWSKVPEFLSSVFLVPEEINIPSVPLKAFINAYSGFYPNFSIENLDEALSHFNLTLDIHLGSLSMGQKKKAFLAFALACNTQILLMDEPTNGLDIPGKSEFRRAIAKTMNDERTIVISTHQVRDLEQLLDHVTIMDQSGIKMNKSIADLQSEYSFCFSPILPSEGILWSEPVMAGYAYMKKREKEDIETEVNLETLFNYINSKQS